MSAAHDTMIEFLSRHACKRQDPATPSGTIGEVRLLACNRGTDVRCAAMAPLDAAGEAQVAHFHSPCVSEGTAGSRDVTHGLRRPV